MIQILDVDGLPGDRGQPLHLRVAAQVRRTILARSLAPRARLPSSRTLAHDLKVSRPTVERAFDLLEAEGFVTRKRGSGTYVAATLPERERLPAASQRHATIALTEPVLSLRGAGIASYPGHADPTIGVAFTPSVPALELFPRALWGRLVARSLSRPGSNYWAYGASAGIPELREAIAAHVAGTRAVSCGPEQVIVLSSTQQGIDLVSRVLLARGDAAWVENPGYPPAVHLLRAAGAAVTAVAVDSDGFDVEAALALAPGARLAYVTPSHQYPGGGTMSLPRRLALLAWAVRERAWIIEDDYDGDLRYAGRPLASLQALDPGDRVIYLGTFNKMLFPSLRIGFLVAPAALVTAFTNAKHLMDGHAPGHTQGALAEFIERGHLAAHLRVVLSEYDRRRTALLRELELLADQVEVGPSSAGLHLSVYLRRALDDTRIAAECRRQGVDLHPLSRFYVGAPRAGFVLGLACARPARIRAAMRIVARAIAAASESKPTW